MDNLSEKLYNTKVPLWFIQTHQSNILSWKQPTVVEYDNHKELTFWNENGEHHLSINSEMPDIEEVATEIHKLPHWAFKVYRLLENSYDSVVLVRDDTGDVFVPKLWGESELSEAVGRKCILTSMAELENETEKIEAHF